MDRWGRKFYIIGGNTPGHVETEDSDFKAVTNGFISITPLHLDWTNYASLEALSKRKI